MKMFLHHDLHRQIWREIEALSAKLRDGGMCEEQAARRATRVDRTEKQAFEAWEQACRQRWRALALAIKAKLEAVESGISEFDSEFMAHIVLPSGLTTGETVLPNLPEVITTGKLPPLLPGPQ